MCGIIGICLRGEDVLHLGEALYRGLLRLEYRGYDSAGVAVIDGGRLVITKGKGKLKELEAKYGFTKLKGVTGIGHTRWATHGPPSDTNAHPHVDCKYLFAVVHNGIIENYYELKKALLERGHVFRSETDTEVVVHLVEEFYGEVGNVFEAFKRAVKLLKGAYALLMITPLEPDKIFFAKKDSPLILGIGDHYNLAASDIPALLDHTRKAVVLRDLWVGYISHRDIYVEDLASGSRVDYEKCTRLVEWNVEDASKEGYPHFMLKEIHEQPRALLQTLSGIRGDEAVKKAVSLLLSADTIYVTGAGTSYHASEFFALMSTRLARKPVLPFIASEYEAYEKSAEEGDVLLAISQSGETIDVLKAVRAFRRAGVKVIAVSNVVESAIPRESDLTVYMRAGPEIGVAATKTFLAQALVLSWIGLEYALSLGAVDYSEYSKARKDLEHAGQLAEASIMKTEDAVRKLSDRIAGSTNMYYLSRGIGIPVAREGALKIKEIAYVHAEAYPAGESKHGPIALIEPGFPVVFVVPDDALIERKVHGNVEEMKARGALTIGVLHENSYLKDYVDVAIEVPGAHWIMAPITHTPPLQLLAYYLAVKRGYDPDKPRNLAKTVTVE
ncbi:MAG: glutamine--fructose-6-phosphate transaminase (isomerizing) [Desulfurococcaceae archaeon]